MMPGSPPASASFHWSAMNKAIEIDNLLRSHLSPDRYELHRLLCGNAAQFQGDERDVIFNFSG